ncbi:MAG: DUF4340 domain-containing protein [Deltaproteobacteria bacterium]|nr:DUF4340 domain-containing protein [Deltaproteobacteria bacterium]
MTKTNKILIALLAVQAVLAAITWTAVKSTPEVTKKAPFFSFKSDDVTKVQVVATQGDKVQDPIVLEKDGDQWVLASSDKYPVKTDVMTELLDLLTQITVDSPIATTSANHVTLNVAKDAFDRKVTLTAGGKDITVYLGRNTRGNAQIREEGKNDVFEAVGVSVWSINSRASHYVDTQYLLADADKTKRVTVTNAKGTIDFVKSGDDWDIPGLLDTLNASPEKPAEGEDAPLPKQLDKSAIKGFIDKFLDVKLSEPVGKTAKDEFGLKNGAKVVIETEKDGKPHTVELTVGDKDDASYRYIKSSDSEFIVKAANYGMEPATQKEAKDFVKDAAPDNQNEPEMPQGMPQGMPPGMMMPQGGMPPGMMMQ